MKALLPIVVIASLPSSALPFIHARCSEHRATVGAGGRPTPVHA